MEICFVEVCKYGCLFIVGLVGFVLIFLFVLLWVRFVGKLVFVGVVCGSVVIIGVVVINEWG